MKKSQGLTILKLMSVLFVAGIVAWFVLDYVIDKRCEGDASTPMCVERTTAKK
jgi:hypothetical protein